MKWLGYIEEMYLQIQGGQFSWNLLTFLNISSGTFFYYFSAEYLSPSEYLNWSIIYHTQDLLVSSFWCLWNILI